jgi:asparagine synthase (glutamine-hydrolysing)
MAAVDRARSFRLFYTVKDNDIIISDSVEALLEYAGKPEPDENALQSFFAAGYVTGSRTLISNISQIRAGEYICYSKGRLSTGYYHTFIPSHIPDSSVPDLTDSILKCMDAMGERTSLLLKNRTAVIPLSSGFDSRFIASTLKHIGINDAICFTYGRKDNYETGISKKVAEKLGYKWLFIEYNSELTDGYLEDPVFQEYYKYSAGYSAMFFMQEYFAVKYLHEKGLIPGNALFIPGHSGDVLAGGHLWEDINEKTNPTQLAGLIYDKNYILNKPPRPVRKKLTADILENLPDSIYPFAVYQDWELKERHAKFIINSANIYNFFGYEYIMPLWDLDLLDFYTLLPYRHRIFKNFYNSVLKNHIFSRNGLNFDSENLPADRSIKIQRYKNKIKRYIPEILKKPFYHHPDPFYYREITAQMISDLLQRKHKVNTGVQYENAYIVQWYIYKVMERLKAGRWS